MKVYGTSIDLPFSIVPVENSSVLQSISDTPSDNQTELEEEDELWFDTMMYAKGHYFGYNGDI